MLDKVSVLERSAVKEYDSHKSELQEIICETFLLEYWDSRISVHTIQMFEHLYQMSSFLSIFTQRYHCKGYPWKPIPRKIVEE